MGIEFAFCNLQPQSKPVQNHPAFTFLYNWLNGRAPELCIVLGSGMEHVVSDFSEIQSIDYHQIPGFPVSTVEGHTGKLLLLQGKRKTFLVMQGRWHLYEGYSFEEIAVPFRIFAALGLNRFLLLNAAGAVDSRFQPGDLILIRDHINLSFRFLPSPQTVNSNCIWSTEGNGVAQAAAKEAGIELNESVYVLMTGPSYETPAEIQMLSKMGAGLVGMSTVPEAIALAGYPVQVTGISVVSNFAAGLSALKLSHKEVGEAVHHAEKKLKEFLLHFQTLSE